MLLLRPPPHCLLTPQTGSWRLDGCRVETSTSLTCCPWENGHGPAAGGDCAAIPTQPPAMLHPEPSRGPPGGLCACIQCREALQEAASTRCGALVVVQGPSLLPPTLHAHVGSTGSHGPGANGSVFPTSVIYFLTPWFGHVSCHHGPSSRFSTLKYFLFYYLLIGSS